MGLDDQSRLRQRTESLCFIFSQFRGSIRRLSSFSKEQQNEHDETSDPQSVLDQDNLNTNKNRSLSLSSSFYCRMFPSKEEPKPDSDEQNVVEIKAPTMDIKELEPVENDEKGRVCDSEDEFKYARSPSFDIYLTKSFRVCKDESKDSDEDEPTLGENKSKGSSISNEVVEDTEERTEEDGRRFMKGKSQTIRKNLLVLRNAIRSLRARFTLKKMQ